MADHFIVDMLPGREGDCLWIEYGDEDKTHRIIVDGGRQIAYDTMKARFDNIPDNEREFELLVNTHVDADHIEGLLKLVEDPSPGVRFKDVWFNGFVHLSKPTGLEEFGAKQGERFADGVIKKGWPWNKAFNGEAMVIPDDGTLPVIPLAGDMTVTILSPDWTALEKFKPKWEKEVRDAGLVPGHSEPADIPNGLEPFGGSLTVETVKAMAGTEFDEDVSKANGVSLSLLFEFGGKSLLLTGDAHDSRMIESLKALNPDHRVKIDAFKLSHHGSKGALSNEQLDQIDCDTYLVSTDGSRHNHPDREAISRVIVTNDHPVKLVGNYRSIEMQQWMIPTLQNEFGYEIILPTGEDGIMRVNLI